MNDAGRRTIEEIAARLIARSFGCGGYQDDAAALAWLTRAEQAILMVYAGEYNAWRAASDYMEMRGHSRTASADAMNRILWSRPDITIGERARQLHIRKSDYAAQVRAAKSELVFVLHKAARGYLQALSGNRKHPPIPKLVETNLNAAPREDLHRRRVGYRGTGLAERKRATAAGTVALANNANRKRLQREVVARSGFSRIEMMRRAEHETYQLNLRNDK